MVYRLTILLALGCVSASLPAAAGIDYIAVVNAVRQEGCASNDPVETRLLWRRELDAAARLVAGGESLLDAARSSGYVARNTASIRIRNVDDADEAARILGSRFCNIVTDDGLEDIGVHARGADVWMLLASALGAPAADEVDASVDRVLQLVNEARAEPRRCGRNERPAAGPLAPNAILDAVALRHARDMAENGFLGHRGSDGSTPAERVAGAGYGWRAVAENVAAGQPSADEVVGTWLASASHCDGLMSPKYDETGIAFVVDPSSEDVIYWVQVFGSRD